MSVVALVPAAGRGERLGMSVPKAFVQVAGVPLLTHAVRGVLSAGCVDAVVVAAPAADLPLANAAVAEFGRVVTVVVGGASRTASVRRALDAAPPDADVVLVHDAARAFTPSHVFRSVVAAVRAGAPAVVPVIPLVDTVKHVDDRGAVVSTVDRSTLRSVQTPQGFRPDVLRRAHDLRTDLTDDAGLVEAMRVPVTTVAGDARAFKVTTPLDLLLAEAVARAGVPSR